MLYLDRTLGRTGLWSRVMAHFMIGLSGRRTADLELLSLNPHLRRDLGLEDASRALTRPDLERH